MGVMLLFSSNSKQTIVLNKVQTTLPFPVKTKMNPHREGICLNSTESFCIFIISKNKPNTTLHFKNKNAYCGCTEKQNCSWKTEYFRLNNYNKNKGIKRKVFYFVKLKTFGPTKCSPLHATLKIHANVKLSSMEHFRNTLHMKSHKL